MCHRVPCRCVSASFLFPLRYIDPANPFAIHMLVFLSLFLSPSLYHSLCVSSYLANAIEQRRCFIARTARVACQFRAYSCSRCPVTATITTVTTTTRRNNYPLRYNLYVPEPNHTKVHGTEMNLTEPNRTTANSCTPTRGGARCTGGGGAGNAN